MMHEYRIVNFVEPDVLSEIQPNLAGAIQTAEAQGWEVFALVPSSRTQNLILIVLRKRLGT